MNLKVISRNTGMALLVSSLFMLVAAGISLYDGGDKALAPLLISFALTFTVGIFPFIFVRKTDGITLRDGYMIIFLSWILSFVFGMLPYVLYGGPFTLANAWFECVSGFTTTGATILEDVEALPRSLLFWRSSTHFIGGLATRENTKPTSHDKIMIASVREYDFEDVSDDIENLINCSYQFDSMATVAKMKDLVPEFKSLNSKYSVLDNQ